MEKEEISFISKKKELLSEKIHDEILELIIKNASEEEIVLNEKRLMELFGVSKAPVREALIKLCSEGVLRNVPRYGYVVVQLSEKDARDTISMRIMLELEALREGYETIVEYRLPDIKAQMERTAGASDVWQVWEDNEEFHLLLASCAGNQLLLRFLRECMGIQKRIYAQHTWNKRKSLQDCIDVKQHQNIYQALCEKNLEKTLELLRGDIASIM